MGKGQVIHIMCETKTSNSSQQKETNINQKSLDYVIFDIIPIRVSAIKDIRTEDPDDYAIYRSDYCKEPPYVTDIINMELKTEILNVACEIKDMIAFDGFHSHMGAMLYVTTDKGVFVKYYTDEISEGTWFTEEDFQKFGKAYYEYLVEISCGGEVEPCKCLSPREEDTLLKFSYWWIAIPVGVCAVLALFAAFIYRKPRLNKNFKYM